MENIELGTVITIIASIILPCVATWLTYYGMKKKGDIEAVKTRQERYAIDVAREEKFRAEVHAELQYFRDQNQSLMDKNSELQRCIIKLETKVAMLEARLAIAEKDD